MPSLLVRNLSPETVERLKARARDHGRSLQAEVAAILEENTAPPEDLFEALLAASHRFRNATAGRPMLDSAALIREDRDSDDHGRSLGW